jgi:hypothetical protein
MELDNIINNFEQHRNELINILSENNWKHFNLYFFIREKYLENDFGDEFKASYCKFYIMNGARGLNESQKNKYFELLIAKENKLEIILNSLYQIHGYMNRHKLFLSFGTKLLHTINEDLPIYDSNISRVLQLPRQIYSIPFEEKINNRIEIYNVLKENFKHLLNDATVRDFIKRVRCKFMQKAILENFHWQDELISDLKLLDSLLWALYQILRYC